MKSEGYPEIEMMEWRCLSEKMEGGDAKSHGNKALGLELFVTFLFFADRECGKGPPVATKQKV